MSNTMDIPRSLLGATMEMLRRHAPFDNMEKGRLEFMISRIRLAYYARGEIILSPDEGDVDRFFVIKQGVVQGEQNVADAVGDEAFWELTEGECFPLGALLAKRVVSSVYRAREDTFLFELSGDNFREMVRTSPQFHDFCTRRIANLLEQSKKIIQAQYSGAMSEQQSMNSPLASIIRKEPVYCPPETPIRSVLSTMHELGIGSMVAVDTERRPIGIFTLHDVLNRVALPQIDLSRPLMEVMSTKLTTLPPHAFAYEAALAMARDGIRHVIITDNEKLAGLVSEKDLFSLQRVGLRQISNSIRGAHTVEALQQSARDIRQLARNMLAQGVAAEQLMQFVSTLNDLLTVRIIEMECVASGLSDAFSCESWFCWIAMGSEGRHEQTLCTDQDNGIIFIPPDGETADSMREKLMPVARRVNETLDKCGFPLCKGDVMAGNPEWLLSMDEWKKKIAAWVDMGDPVALLNSVIFFDFRRLYGNEHLAVELRGWLLKKASSIPRFLHQMADIALQNRPPLGLMRDFAVEQHGDKFNTIDIKLNGVAPFVDAARIYSLATGSEATSTAQRLLAAGRSLKMSQTEVEAWIGAFDFIQLLRLRLQHEAANRGVVMDNYVNPDELNDLDRRILKESFRQARKLQSKLAMDFRVQA